MLKDLIDNLRKLPGEVEWVEFKLNYIDPQEVGEYIPALSNSACLAEKDTAYLVFGVEDGTHEVKGTTYPGIREKIGNEDIENWLRTQLDPHIDFKVEEAHCNGMRLVIFSIDATTQRPISFKDVEYIRVGSYKKKLKEHPEKAAKIWEKCSGKVFEKELVIKSLNADEVLKLLSYPSYFDSLGLALPMIN
jgi:ATP-dependent DNA helicase RecG